MISSQYSKLRKFQRALFGGIELRGKNIPYLDIGARGNIARVWQVVANMGGVKPYLFEADSVEAASLAERLSSSYTVLPYALGAVNSEEELRITKLPSRSSLLEPTSQDPDYEVVRREHLQLKRLDSIWQSEWGAPRFVKLDVQGYELKVLAGFGVLAQSIDCIEIEIALKTNYCDQPLIQEVLSTLGKMGFDLVKISPNGLIGGLNIEEVNAFFVRSTMHSDPAVKVWKQVNDVGSHKRVLERGY